MHRQCTCGPKKLWKCMQLVCACSLSVSQGEFLTAGCIGVGDTWDGSGKGSWRRRVGCDGGSRVLDRICATAVTQQKWYSHSRAAAFMAFMAPHSRRRIDASAFSRPTFAAALLLPCSHLDTFSPLSRRSIGAAALTTPHLCRTSHASAFRSQHRIRSSRAAAFLRLVNAAALVQRQTQQL